VLKIRKMEQLPLLDMPSLRIGHGSPLQVPEQLHWEPKLLFVSEAADDEYALSGDQHRNRHLDFGCRIQ